MKITYKNEIHDEERAFYGIENASFISCEFFGPADGESALKEVKNIELDACRFLLRYPLWHATDVKMTSAFMSDTCRAALWYDKNIEISASDLVGTKALRECENVLIKDTKINSAEFGWFCKNVKLNNSSLESEYPFLKSYDMEFDGFKLKGKYSFQYVKNVVIKNSYLDTKDAFWHSENVTVYDSVVKGEYLGWYSENLRLVRCKIIGTQPLCYAKNLILEDCETELCDLSFEKSEVCASIKGEIVSVKNPLGGKIIADKIGSIILDSKTSCEIKER